MNIIFFTLFLLVKQSFQRVFHPTFILSFLSKMYFLDILIQIQLDPHSPACRIKCKYDIHFNPQTKDRISLWRNEGAIILNKINRTPKKGIRI